MLQINKQMLFDSQSRVWAINHCDTADLIFIPLFQIIHLVSLVPDCSPPPHVTAKTQHTGGFTPCTDGLHDGPGTDTIPPSLHVLEFTEKPMQGYMYKKVTIHVWYLLKCLSAPGKMVSFSQS